MIQLLCIDDVVEKPSFFRWISGLEPEKVKDPRLTKGKLYDLIDVRSRTYGSPMVNYTFVHYLIKSDTGCFQLMPTQNFEIIHEIK